MIVDCHSFMFFFLHNKKMRNFEAEILKIYIMKKNETLEGLMKLWDFNMDELLENARMMGFNAHHELEKLETAELRKRLSSEVLEHPKQVLSRLPAEDLQLLLILKDAEPGMGMKMHDTTQMLSMGMLGLAEQESGEEEGTDIVTITDDFKKAIRPYVDEVLNDFEVKFRLYVEQFAIGALNIYGVLTVRELKNILRECMDLEDDGTGVFDHIFPQSVALQMQYHESFSRNEESFITSPFVHDYGYIMKERAKRKETATLKTFNRDDIRAAGEMPTPGIPNPVSKRLLDVLEHKMGFTKKESYFWEYMLWRMAQDEDVQTTELIQMLMGDPLSSHNLHSLDDLNGVIQVVVDYQNHAPRWIFRGRCPVELRIAAPNPAMPPHIELGPNMRSMGYRQENVQQHLNDLWADEFESDSFDSFMPYIAPKKVGRNDPCPCGSGKKYKNCCGRGN